MTALRITYVEPNYVQKVWPAVKEYIASALNKGSENKQTSNDYNVDHVQSYLTSGEWLLVVAADEDENIHG